MSCKTLSVFVAKREASNMQLSLVYGTPCTMTGHAYVRTELIDWKSYLQ